MHGSHRRSSPRGEETRRRASVPMLGATTVSRARSRPVGFLRRRGRRSCHAGAAARSFRWSTSRRDRSRGAPSPRRERPVVASPPRVVLPRPARRVRPRIRARREPSHPRSGNAAPAMYARERPRAELLRDVGYCSEVPSAGPHEDPLVCGLPADGQPASVRRPLDVTDDAHDVGESAPLRMYALLCEP